MPRGGNRGGGRPSKAAQAAKAEALAAAIAAGPKTSPRVLLQGIMDSPASTKMEKMKAVELFVKLPLETASHIPAEPLPLPPIICIPRGVFLSEDQIDNIEELAKQHGVPIEPYSGTGDWTQTAAGKREPVVEPLEVADEPTLEPEAAPLPVSPMDMAPNVQRLQPRERVYTEGARHDSSRRPSAQSPFTHKPYDPFDAA